MPRPRSIGAALAAALFLAGPFTGAAALAQDMAAAPAGTAAPAAEAPWLTTLRAGTPQEGFDLAVTMARRAVRTTQPDVDVLKAQRPEYASDADSLIAVSGAAAQWFATIAAANDYWRD
ncbi:MAG TPA: hexameric tyrosine-coordinated heme protein [Paracoccus sp. (in: a-proteobacteria)]|nr:hexameric tyrosine-coordinated heme protein [Paracoccus sp. (in: a-proteobacteria)]